MGLGDVVSLAQVVNALAVLLTLIVLIVSIRQNTKTQRALAVDSLAAAIATINVPLIQFPEVGSAVSRAVGDWTAAGREERIMAHYFLFSFFKLNESAWYQQKERVLDSEQWLGWERSVRKYCHSKGVREVWWPARRQAYSQPFQQFLARTTEPTDLGSLADLFDYAPKQA